MLDPETGERALAELARRSSLRSVRQLHQSELSALRAWNVVRAIEGEITVEGRDVRLQIGVNSRFPLSLPVIALSPPDALGLIPHVEVDGDGYVCYNQTEGMLLDSSNPEGILEEALDRAVAVLCAGITGKNRLDFVDELAAYWRRVAPKQVLRSFLRVEGSVREIGAYRSGSGYELVADSLDDARAYYNGNDRALGVLTRKGGLYVPLSEGTFVLPPRKNRPWSLGYIKSLVEDGVSEDNRQELEKLGRRSRSEELVVIAVPRPRGGATLVGLLFRGMSDGHPLLGGKVTSQIPMQVHRYDPPYLLPRSGGQLSLHKCRVLVAGCGAVGGHVALALARAGVGHLALVDPDAMTLENTFRNVLGNGFTGQPKVEALKKEILSKYPYVSVATYQKYVERAVANRSVDLASCDLVVFASGNPTVELYMNQLLHRTAAPPKSMYTWLEPYGIGGHALLVNPGSAGCLQCLYTPAWEDEPALYNRASFAAPGQFFGIDDLGCGSLYTPYGSLDAERTATQAVSLALDALTGRESGNPLLSWKGPGDQFTAARFRVSPRYALSQADLWDTRYGYVSPRCPVCGGGFS